MSVNRAVQPRKGHGEPVEDLELKSIPKPSASPGNVVVRVLLRPVNPTDRNVMIMGFWANLDLSEVVSGAEGMGVVHELGEGVSSVKVGQKVIPFTYHRYYPSGYGLWRDYVEVPEADLVPVPADMSDELAAQFIINPWTAYGMLEKLAVPKGEYILQMAAGSVLGRQILSLAKYYGIKTINVVRRDEWIQPLKDLGADYVINSSTEDVETRVQEITGGKGAYGSLDPVAGESAMLAAACTRAGGLVIVYGIMSGTRCIIDFKDMMRRVTLGAFNLSIYTLALSKNLPKRAETTKVILDLLSKKIIDPMAGSKTYPLEEFREAIAETLRAGRGGKVFLSSY